MDHLQRAFGSKLARSVISLMAIPMILACTCAGSIPALPGSKSTPTPAIVKSPTRPSSTRPAQPTAAVQPTTAAGGGSELRQWATAARASSHYGGGNDWSPDKATGAPDVPACSDNADAWASEGQDTVEWIELTYATPVHVTLVKIVQTYNPTQIVKVELIDTDGKAHAVYDGKPKKVTCPQTLNISFQKTSYLVNRVKITIDQSALGLGWNEIDAVELVGVK